MFRSVVFIVGLLAFSNGDDPVATQVSQCTVNQAPLPIHTYIEGCVTPPCLLPQEQDAIVNMVFRAPRTMRSMTTLGTAYMALGPIPVPIPYPLGEQAITCNFLLNSYCPVIEGEVLVYQLRMYIHDIFPEDTQVPIEFRIVDEHNVLVTCVRVVIRIVPPIGGASANGTLIDA